LQAFIGADAVVNRVRQALACGGASTLSKRLNPGQTPTPELLAQEAEAGDALCLEIVAEVARHLGVGIVNIMNTLDPDGLLLGGAMTFGGNCTPLGRQFLQWVKEEVARRAFAALVEHTVIEFAALGDDAACFGAAGIARADHAKSI
jgi:glucokinase